MDFKDYYKTLGVDKTATADDIRKAYRKLVRKYHPDVSKEPDAAQRMRDVNEANDVLSDKEKRTAYDTLYERVQNGGAQWSGQNFQPPPGWDEGFTFRRGTGANGAFSDESGFSDFFSSIFGSARSQKTSSGTRNTFKIPGEDQHASIEISIQDALKGAHKDITLRTLAEGAHGMMQWQPRTLRVKIPAGTHSGQFIRLSGQGMPDQGGAPNGDLYLEVRITPDALYHVEGKDIYMKLPLTPSEAALGTQIQLPLPDGQKINMTIPPNTRNGSKLRIKERGFPGNPPGHMYLNIEIVLPAANTEKAKQAYQALAEATHFNPRTF